MRFIDPAFHADIQGTLQTTAATQNATQTLQFTSRGTFRDEPFDLEGKSEGLTELRNIDAPYRLSLTGRAGDTALKFDGTVVPSQPQNLKGALHLKGPDLSKLYPIVPVALPWTPRYDLASDLTHENGKWIFQGMHGTVGNSDLAGDLTVDVSTSRALTSAELTSRKFDYKDFGGFVGLQRGNAPNASAADKKAVRANEARRGNGVLSDHAFQLAKLRAHDVDVKFKGTSFTWGRFPLDNLATHLTLKSGVMRFDPLDFGIAGGHVVTSIALDLTPDVPKAEAKVDALSGGQQQRLMIARALIHEPRVLFLDEPTVGLDPQARLALWDVLRDLHRQGRTIVMTTHYMEEADQLCDRLAIIDRGKLLALDTPARLKSQAPGDTLVEVTFDADAEPLADAARGIPGVSRAEARGPLLRVYGQRAGEIIPALIAAADANGRTVRDVHLSRPSLETLFISLTGRKLA